MHAKMEKWNSEKLFPIHPHIGFALCMHKPPQENIISGYLMYVGYSPDFWSKVNLANTLYLSSFSHKLLIVGRFGNGVLVTFVGESLTLVCGQDVNGVFW